MAKKKINELPDLIELDGADLFVIQKDEGGTTVRATAAQIQTAFAVVSALESILAAGNTTGANDIIIEQGRKLINPSETFGIQLGITSPISVGNILLMGDYFDLASPPTTGIQNGILIGGASVGQDDIIITHQNKDDGIDSSVSLSSEGVRLRRNEEDSEYSYSLEGGTIYEVAKTDDSPYKETIVGNYSDDECSKIVQNLADIALLLEDASNNIKSKIALDSEGLQLQQDNGAGFFNIRKTGGVLRIVNMSSTLQLSDTLAFMYSPEIDLQAATRVNIYGATGVVISSNGVVTIASQRIRLNTRDLIDQYEPYYVGTAATTIFTITDYFPAVEGLFCVSGKVFLNDFDNGAGTGQRAVYELKHYFKYSSGSYTSVGTPELVEIYNDSIVASCVWDFSSGFGPLLKVAREGAIATDLDFKLSIEIEYL